MVRAIPWALPILRTLTAVALVAATPCARAIEPGRTIAPEQAKEIESLVLPGVADAARRGMRLEVVEPRKVLWRRAYTEATEKYAGQVKLGPKGELQNYVAGLPFANVDRNDPQAGLKLMWNYTFGPWIADDARSWGWDWQIGSLTTGQPMTVEAQEHGDLERAKYLRLAGRTEVPPLPTLPGGDAGVFAKEILGVSMPLFVTLQRNGPILTYYYLDLREPETWWYVEAERKVRRLLPQTRYETAGGMIVDLNTQWGFSGPLGSYGFRLVGEQTMLGVLHARRYPAEWCPGGGDFAACDVWEERPVYVIEATAKKPYDIYSKRILALDRQAWVIVASDLYDRQDRLWKTFLNFWSYQPDARGADSQERPYLPAATCIDLIQNRAHRWRLPGTRPLADTVAINEGLIDKDFVPGVLERAR